MHQHQHNEKTNRTYGDVKETSGNPNHYTIETGDLNAQVGRQTNPIERAIGNLRSS